MPADSDHTKSLARQQFGTHAQNYVTSPVHAQSYSLDRVIALLDPQPGQRALDLATGGGHTALALARRGARTLAGDLTFAMLQAARAHIADKLGDQAGLVNYVQLDAECLPFARASFDLLTCRIAPHHFPDVPAFVRECARVCAPGGTIAIIDQLSPADPRAAEYVNAFERLRDPSHVWAYNAVEWRGFFTGLGLDVIHFEEFDTWHDLTPWAARMGNDADTVHRLRAMLVHAPGPVAAWMQPQCPPVGDARFAIRQFILLARA